MPIEEWLAATGFVFTAPWPVSSLNGTFGEPENHRKQNRARKKEGLNRPNPLKLKQREGHTGRSQDKPVVDPTSFPSPTIDDDDEEQKPISSDAIIEKINEFVAFKLSEADRNTLQLWMRSEDNTPTELYDVIVSTTRKAHNNGTAHISSIRYFKRAIETHLGGRDEALTPQDGAANVRPAKPNADQARRLIVAAADEALRRGSK